MKRLSTLSQNFLRSPRLVKILLGHTSIKPADTVYDIGAGSGVVTAVLAQKCRQVVAVEVDPRVVPTLRHNMAPYPQVRIEQADILALPLPHTPYKVFANIPFALSSPIVRKLTEAPNPPEAAYMIVQKEFANKLLPDHKGFTNQLGITMGVTFAARIRYRLHPSDFTPPPRIAPVLLELSRRPAPLLAPARQAAFQAFVAECFTNPHVFARAPLAAAGLPSHQRASQLTLQEWLQLFSAAQ